MANVTGTKTIISGPFETPPVVDTSRTEETAFVGNSSLENKSAMGDNFNVENGSSSSGVAASSDDQEKSQARKFSPECEPICDFTESSENSCHVKQKNKDGRCSKFISKDLLSSLVAKVPKSVEQMASTPDFSPQGDGPTSDFPCLFGSIRRLFLRKKINSRHKRRYVTTTQPISHTETVTGRNAQQGLQPSAAAAPNRSNGYQVPAPIMQLRATNFYELYHYTNLPFPMPGSTPVNCRGLECLNALDKLLILQEIFIEDVCGLLKQENRYRIFSEDGNNIMYALEHSKEWPRQCCCGRSSKIEIIDGKKHEVIRITQPWRCSCCCCYLQNVEVESPPGSAIGRIRQKCSMLRTRLTILDANNKEVFIIKGPRCPPCNCGMCCKAKFLVFSINGRTQVAFIKKLWAGCYQEFQTPADNFEIIFLTNLEVRLKALLIAACLLIDYIYYDGAI